MERDITKATAGDTNQVSIRKAGIREEKVFMVVKVIKEVIKEVSAKKEVR